ncbi:MULTISPECIES: DUF2804 domain-containing protein [Thermomonosporaceae]|uniref:DUF2804 domain-containing protein n=1 Tax=Thermomonosporaceae TaxID=2012 RepID=UPI00255B0086|nr:MULTISPECIES: DUF2804 domain-containing protein [Thermomonosporaceae]MDL4776541.1 DUF2804 domain-containing protein [Actinomadura xylanilytica]
MPEREITGPVDLCLPDGRLNPAAAGWSRSPVHRANLRGWGRTKRWEYWCVTTPRHLIALTVSDLDYLALSSVYFLEYGGREFERSAIAPFALGVSLPERIAGAGGADVTVGPERPTGGRVRVAIRKAPGGTRLRARCVTPDGLPVEADLTVGLPDGHETLSVVVPWSDDRFQYTSKHTARPASGSVRIGTEEYAFGEDAWGVLDHGRGRWPRAVTWNWGAASGRTGGRLVGLQLGGRWTEGTGTTENALCVDGRLTKIGEELDWRYDLADPLAPWTIRTPDAELVDLTFAPFHDRTARIDTGLLANRTDQCFGRYSGRIRTAAGEDVQVDGLLGWAEEVRMRW